MFWARRLRHSLPSLALLPVPSQQDSTRKGKEDGFEKERQELTGQVPPLLTHQPSTWAEGESSH